MSSKVNANFKVNFMTTKIEYDSLSLAIKLARLNGAEEKSIQSLIIMKQKVKDQRVQDDTKMLKSMSLANNIVHLEGSWYAVRYLNEKNDSVLKLDILRAEDIPILQRDGRNERELSRRDLDTMLPGCLDEAELEIYKQLTTSRAQEYVYDVCQVEIVPEAQLEVVRPITVSSHAGMRFVQRKLRIGMSNETVAEDYRRTHLKEVEAGVLEGYAKSEQVWIADDGMVFNFDEDNVMYVIGNAGGPNNIITLYEEDFGFSKEINRVITIKQLDVLTVARESLRSAEQEHDEAVRGSDDEVRSIADEIALLQAQIELLSAQRVTIMAGREQHTKALRVAKSRYSVEFNKLFKKWDT